METRRILERDNDQSGSSGVLLVAIRKYAKEHGETHTAEYVEKMLEEMRSM